MPLRLLPDSEALVIDYLKAHASITALVSTRVTTELPPQPVFPLLTVFLVSGDERAREHLDEALIQLAAWADTKASANLIIRTARAVMLQASAVTHARGVVTGVRTLVAPHWFPDDTVPQVRPRYLCDLGVVLHPHPL